jgi:hypothetical protein
MPMGRLDAHPMLPNSMQGLYIRSSCPSNSAASTGVTTGLRSPCMLNVLLDSVHSTIAAATAAGCSVRQSPQSKIISKAQPGAPVCCKALQSLQPSRGVGLVCLAQQAC